MGNSLAIGDQVRLTGCPNWLVHDLPESEQREIRACVGKVAVIEQIDDGGYYWVGFGATEEGGGSSIYSGHSFCVTSEYLEPVIKER